MAIKILDKNLYKKKKSATLKSVLVSTKDDRVRKKENKSK